MFPFGPFQFHAVQLLWLEQSAQHSAAVFARICTPLPGSGNSCRSCAEISHARLGVPLHRAPASAPSVGAAAAEGGGMAGSSTSEMLPTKMTVTWPAGGSGSAPVSESRVG